MLSLLFDPRYGVAQLIHNPEEFYPATLRALRDQMQMLQAEKWHVELIAALSAQTPLFRQYWAATQADHAYPTAARPLTRRGYRISRRTKSPWAAPRPRSARR